MLATLAGIVQFETPHAWRWVRSCVLRCVVKVIALAIPSSRMERACTIFLATPPTSARSGQQCPHHHFFTGLAVSWARRRKSASTIVARPVLPSSCRISSARLSFSGHARPWHLQDATRPIRQTCGQVCRMPLIPNRQSWEGTVGRCLQAFLLRGNGRSS